MTKFIDFTLNGISTGAIYAAVALALVLIWRATRIVNFAQGAMLMITTYIASAVINSTGSYVVGFVVALACGLVLGAIVERVLIRPVENRPAAERGDRHARALHVPDRAGRDDLGRHPAVVPAGVLDPRLQDRRHAVLFAPNDTFIVLVVVVVAVGLGVLFRYTTLGLQMRAAAFKPEVAQLLGVRVGRMFTIGWGLAALTGAIAGVLVAPSVFVAPNNFDPILISGFVAAVLGGLDSPPGAVVGATVLGLVLSYVAGYEGDGRWCRWPRWSCSCSVLMIRPTGLFPAAKRATRMSALASGPPARVLRRFTLARSLALVIGLGVVLVLITDVLGDYQELQLAQGAYYFAVLAGLSVLIGLSGKISLGHGAFMAVGAYTVMLLVGHGWALFPSVVAAAVIAAVIGIPVGVAASRLHGPYLAGATLAFAVGLPALADRFPGLLGGENGLTINPPAVPSFLGASFSLEQWQAWIACAGALVVLFVLYNLVHSRVGRSLRATRDDEIAASLCGLNIGRQQTLAFVVSAACAGLGGGLYAVVLNLATPSAFPLTLSLSLLTGVVVGGLGSLAGAAWGAAMLVLLPSWTNDLAHSLSLSTNAQGNLPYAIYGLVLIIVMLAWPTGIQGGRAGHLKAYMTNKRRRA